MTHAFNRMRQEAREKRLNTLICDILAGAFALAMWAAVFWTYIL